MYKSLLLIAIVKLCHLVEQFEMGREKDLYEGDLCTLENGLEGVCKKLGDCPKRLEEVHKGNRDSISNGRCGFDGFTEIVCCPVNSPQNLSTRPADAACEEYKKIRVPPMENTVFIVVYSGIKVKEGEYPFMVALGFPNDDITEDEPFPIAYSCGGSLISYQHVLTAAHCVSNIQGLAPTEIFVGGTDLRDKSTVVQRIPINNIIVHPRYRRSKAYYDVAILKLQRRVNLSANVLPICLYTKPPSTIKKTEAKEIRVAGWGESSIEEGKSTLLLKSPNIGLTSNAECGRHYTNFAKVPQGITGDMICTLDPNKNTSSDACKGDSGGPLLMETPGKSNSAVVFGIAAFGEPCGSYTPGVYTLIYPFLNWIEEQVWGRS